MLLQKTMIHIAKNVRKLFEIVNIGIIIFYNFKIKQKSYDKNKITVL